MAGAWGGVVSKPRVVTGARRGPRYGAVRPVAAAAPRPSTPPAGYYDPSIDASVRASGRGLADLLAAQSTGALRGANDYTTARGDLFRERDEGIGDLDRDYARSGTQFDWQQSDLDRDFGRSNEQFGWQRSDLDTGYGRSMADSQLGEGRLREDYGTALQGLAQNYQRLGGQQAQSFSSAGLSGGAFAQAAQKRTANEAIDRQPLDTNFSRGLADLLQARSRTTEDYGTNSGRLSTQEGWARDDYGTNTGRLGQQRAWAGEDYGSSRQRLWDSADRAGGQLDTAWRRQNEDWQTQSEVAGRENTLFGEDANALKWQQAKGAGYVAPAAVRRPVVRRLGVSGWNVGGGVGSVLARRGRR